MARTSTRARGGVMNTDIKNANFLDDIEKMQDFRILTKRQFLQSYSYLTEQEYDNTAKAVQQ
jgi:hypothetical protein